jgi:hypothetical protein
MKQPKLSLEFINKGKAFEITNWTVTKHENALSKLAEYQKTHSLSEKQMNNEFKYFVIYETLVEVDSTVDIEAIRVMHPIDLVELFNLIYNAGKRGIYAKDFQQPTQQKK